VTLALIRTAAVLVLAAAPVAQAQDPEGWTLHLMGDRAGITLFDGDDTWWTGRAQIGVRREGKGGAFGAVEGYRRFGATDTTFLAAGWRHVRKWSFYAEAGVTPAADFYYRRSFEVEAYRRIGDSVWVPHVGYRYWLWPGDQVLHLVSPRVTRYGARSELHGRLIFVHNATRGTDSAAVFVRGHRDVRPRLRLGGGVAKGERIFDVTSLPGEPAPGWVAFAEAHLGVGPRDRLGLTLRVAEEGSEFSQTAITLHYRRAF
jgi:YaiO family outer membrane protein